MPKPIPSRVAAWLDRERVSQTLRRPAATNQSRPRGASGKADDSLGKNHPISRLSQLTIVDESQLDYDSDRGVYCCEGKPFRGLATQRCRNGKLRSLVHYVRGDAHGVCVAWHKNEQLKLYNEVAQGMRNGLYLEWAEDGTLLIEEHYKNGRVVHAGRKTSKRKK